MVMLWLIEGISPQVEHLDRQRQMRVLKSTDNKRAHFNGRWLQSNSARQVQATNGMKEPLGIMFRMNQRLIIFYLARKESSKRAIANNYLQTFRLMQ
jgi:hypothetical protein